MKTILSLFLLITFNLFAFSQEHNKSSENQNSETKTYLYAYILVEGRLFSNKLEVNVDLGDSPQLIKAGQELSEILTGKKSYAAILNEMSQRGYELVESSDYKTGFDETSEKSGVIFIMKSEIHFRPE